METLLEYLEVHWIVWLFGIINSIIAFSCQRLMKKLIKERKNMTALLGSTRALLRSQLLSQYHHYHEELEYCPIYVLDNIEELYLYYTQLGGNGTIRQLVERIRLLPTSKEEK